MSKLFAILHDGTMNGDCAGDPLDTYDVTDDADVTFKSVLEMCGERLKSEMFDEDGIKDVLKDLKGVWIVEESTQDLMIEVANVTNPNNDGGLYTLQRALKAIARRLAVKTLGKNVK